MNPVRHFVDLDRIPKEVLHQLVERAHQFKKNRDKDRGHVPSRPRRTLVMIFEKPSTRTRVSFDGAMHELGGRVVTLDSSSTQLERGETPADTAKVLSRYADALMLRVGSHEIIREFENHATVPVINGLSNHSHPCQVLADVMTVGEHFGSIEGRRITWMGDGNNVAVSWIHAAAPFGIRLVLACPNGRQPPEEVVKEAQNAGADVRIVENPPHAVDGAEVVVTDTWRSMGDDSDIDTEKIFRNYRVDANLMAKADPSAVFLHCLPAHRGHEVSAEVIDGPASLVWDEAENRLHVQKAILEWCIPAG